MVVEWQPSEKAFEDETLKINKINFLNVTL